MRIIALVASYNEERFIEACFEHLKAQGIEVYLCDNESIDDTVPLARRYLGCGLVNIETIPRHGILAWQPLLRKKEELALELDADWFIHLDPDEFRLPARSDQTLAEALTQVDRAGYNAVNFQEYTFIPTVEEPNHDHPNFHRTMRRYYPFLPSFPHRLTAWKKQRERVDLASSGGHRVEFPGLLMFPESFRMRHYLYLSEAQCIRKYSSRVFDPFEINQLGWHGWRGHFAPEMARLAPQAALRLYTSDDELDASQPRTKHYVEDPWPAPGHASAA
jgi:glycosyltransferase involved in cell wall biosynthesis